VSTCEQICIFANLFEFYSNFNGRPILPPPAILSTDFVAFLKIFKKIFKIPQQKATLPRVAGAKTCDK